MTNENNTPALQTQIAFGVKGTSFRGKVAEHRHDPSKVVLKMKHPEAAAAILGALGLEPLGSTLQGSHYFITPAPIEVVSRIGEVLLLVANGDLAFLPTASIAPTGGIDDIENEGGDVPDFSEDDDDADEDLLD